MTPKFHARFMESLAWNFNLYQCLCLLLLFQQAFQASINNEAGILSNIALKVLTK